MTLLLGKRKSLIQRAISILRRYGTDAHVYLPGVGSVAGLAAGNYQESTGITAAAKDQPTGLVLDAMGSVGPELITGAWNLGSASSFIENTASTVTVVQTSGGDAVATKNIVTVAGDTYLFTARITGLPTTNWISCFQDPWLANAQSVQIASDGYVQVYFKAPSTNTKLALHHAPVGVATLTYSELSFKRVTGIHARQTTAGFKPRLVRGAYNILTNSATMGTQSVTTGANTYCLSFTGTGTVTKSGTATGALVGTGAGDRVQQTFTATAGSLTLTVTGSVTLAMLVLGTTASTYVPTTTIAASAETGAQSWLFGNEAVDDTLQLGSVPFQLSDDHAVIMGVTPARTGAGQIFFGQSSVSSNSGPVMGVSAAGQLNYYAAGGGTVCSMNSGAYYVTPGVRYVHSAVSRSLSVTLRANGFTKQTSPLSGTYTTNTVAGIGSNMRTPATEYATGSLGFLIVIKGTISDADLLVIEQAFGRMYGVAI